MKKRYYVWADSDSAIDMPDGKDTFADYNEAYALAAKLAHEHDGKDYRAIFHIDDLKIEETIDTFENIQGEENDAQMRLTQAMQEYHGSQKNVHLTDITWETDGEEVDLPTELTIKVTMTKENKENLDTVISDYLSDQYGYLVIEFAKEIE